MKKYTLFILLIITGMVVITFPSVYAAQSVTIQKPYFLAYQEGTAGACAFSSVTSTSQSCYIATGSGDSIWVSVGLLSSTTTFTYASTGTVHPDLHLLGDTVQISTFEIYPTNGQTFWFNISMSASTSGKITMFLFNTSTLSDYYTAHPSEFNQSVNLYSYPGPIENLTQTPALFDHNSFFTLVSMTVLYLNQALSQSVDLANFSVIANEPSSCFYCVVDGYDYNLASGNYSNLYTFPGNLAPTNVYYGPTMTMAEDLTGTITTTVTVTAWNVPDSTGLTNGTVFLLFLLIPAFAISGIAVAVQKMSYSSAGAKDYYVWLLQIGLILGSLIGSVVGHLPIALTAVFTGILFVNLWHERKSKGGSSIPT